MTAAGGTEYQVGKTVQTAHGMELAILPQHKPWILTIFGLGFAAIFLRLQIKRKKFVRAWRNNHKLATPAGFEAPQVIRPSPE
jgi:hypothetical protein